MTEPQQPTPEVRIPYEAPLIKKSRFENIEQFTARAEKDGIGRECLNCGSKRRFSKLACHHCGSSLHRQCRVQSVDKDLDQSFEEAQQYHYETQTDSSKPTMSTFTPIDESEASPVVSSPGADFSSQNTEPQHDPDIDDGSPVQPPKQLDEYSRPELMKLVKELGGTVSTKDTKDSLLDKYNELVKPPASDDPDLN